MKALFACDDDEKSAKARHIRFGEFKMKTERSVINKLDREDELKQMTELENESLVEHEKARKPASKSESKTSGFIVASIFGGPFLIFKGTTLLMRGEETGAILALIGAGLLLNLLRKFCFGTKAE